MSTKLSPPLSKPSLRKTLSELVTTPLTPVKKSLHDNIDFVPSSIPAQRRLEMLAVSAWSILIVGSCALSMFLCSFPPLWPLITCYTIWVHYLDKSPDHGGRVWQWYRRCAWWRYFVAYYPITCLKVGPSLTKKYGFDHCIIILRRQIYRRVELMFLVTILMVTDRYYRHVRLWFSFGLFYVSAKLKVISRGAFANFGTDVTGFSKLFPGITTHLLTLSSNFKLPFYRECMIHLGMGSVSKRSCGNILQSGPGQSITIVVGGAAESLSAHPGTADLTLRKRLGFIKIAIQEGADLVPVFSFGENDIFSQMPNEKGTAIYMFQKKFQAIFGFTLPLFHGRGMLNYNLGLLPYRRRITAVVGRPIPVKRVDQPDIEEVRRIQTLYIAELQRIWDAHKDEFAKARKRELNIID
ncbi:related to diacylglycerol acyltransferase type 2b [Armillaria ostoyae]|uniref:Diacylglycerol O-acyltransferase n=1 Tax=Armillaria ostoyae TaxID=47428 RepID=A0A284RYC2_ARMOS|nr:related to diacylglycerol acyltransferase type 2b [Armillaria ostoyae]